MTVRNRLLALLPLVALALVGCGGGDDDETTAAPVATPTAAALSKEELLAQGDAVCAEVNAAIGTLASTSTDAAEQVSQRADLYDGMVERLKGLGEPDDAAGYEEFIVSAEGLAQAESDARLAAERGEEGALAEAESNTSSALSAFRSAAQAYGFESCGEAPSAPISGSASAEEGSEEASEGVEEEEEAAPEVEEEVAPETGGAGTAEEGGGAAAGGGSGGGTEGSSGAGSGGIGPG